MSRWQLILRGLLFYARPHLAVALGVAAGTAVLTGALLVGDSVRGSLRHLALGRLGQIDAVLLVDQFFRAEIAAELTSSPDFPDEFETAVPCIFLQGTIQRPPRDGADRSDSGARAGQVTVIGCNEQFWALGSGGPQTSPGPGEIVLNRTLADELRAEVGDEVILRIGQKSDVPADSPLGRKSETIRNRRLVVSEIIPSEGLGRFGLRPNQQLPRNCYVAIGTLTDALQQPGRVNALLVAGKTADEAPPVEAEKQLQAALRPKLADYGLSIELTERGYYQVAAQRMLLTGDVERAALDTFNALQAQPVFTYLANTIRAGDREIPYSTITAVDLAIEPPWGPLQTSAGEVIEPPSDGEIILNQWAADDLDADPGDEIRVTFFKPESTHGLIEEETATFRLKAVAVLSGGAADADLTPKLSGVTDQLSMANWDPPFPYDGSRIRDRDEQYWDQYRATPKAFVSLSAGRRLWSSRFGEATSVRFGGTQAQTLSIDELQRDLESRLDPATSGFVFRPVKRLALAASAGTTSFQWLFLGFSFFVIAAAVMLVALLFRLGAEQRATEVGILTAVGLQQRQVRWLLGVEGLAVAAVGSAIGTAGGVGYAWLMLAGLRTWWVQAITTPFLELYVTSTSLIVGYALGVLVSSAAVLWALRQMRHVSVRRLLAGRADEESGLVRRPPRRARAVAWAMLPAAIAVAGIGAFLSGEAQAGAFFGSGAMVLAACLTLVWAELRAGRVGSVGGAGGGSLLRLAMRNGARNPGRSALTVGLVASASFLIVAISAFRLERPGAESRRESGTGGFALVAESAQPIYYDLNDPDALANLGVSAPQREQLQKGTIHQLRVRPGDDASCLNLYQPQQPRVLGLRDELIRRGGFLWGGTLAESEAEKENPWLLLERDLGETKEGDPIVPVVLDVNTATYSLHIGLGKLYRIDDGRGGEIVFRIVGLLKNSIFQGDLLVSEARFQRCFPNISGYQFFLIEAAQAEIESLEQTLESALGDLGLDATRTSQRLAGFFAVQNTYLSTFQSLGGLGLLLGTFGLAAVQMRNVLERRSELALLRAAGFRRARVASLVLTENVLLLAGGLAVGVASALVTVAPHWLAGGAGIPWGSLAATLAIVLVVGMLAAMLTVRATLRAPLLAALRGD